MRKALRSNIANGVAMSIAKKHRLNCAKVTNKETGEETYVFFGRHLTTSERNALNKDCTRMDAFF